ncbi:MAG TPA: VOC family protein, partial [Cytophagales bacterium]|nr:VOC family protein [Cytophagales bacterium]
VHPSSPPTLPAITSDSGVFLTLEVEDAKAEFESLLRAGIAMHYPLTSEAWGQLRFGITDPNGMYIDIVEQTVPEENYWEKYMHTNLGM